MLGKEPFARRNIVAIEGFYFDREPFAGSLTSESPERMIIVSEYAHGGRLRDSVVGGKFNGNWDVKRRVALEVAYGLAYIHRAQFVHERISDESILLDDRGIPKITDFYLARTIFAESGKQKR